MLRDYAQDPELAVKELQHYADTGTLMHLPEVRPRHPRYWQLPLDTHLFNYAQQRMAVVELVGVDEDRFDTVTAAAAFAASFTSWMISGACVLDWRVCFPDRTPVAFNLTETPFAAMGLVIGVGPQALQLAEGHVHAYRSGWYPRVAHYPIHQLMFRLLAD